MKFIEPFSDFELVDNFFYLKVPKVGTNRFEPLSQCLNVFRRYETYQAGGMTIHSITDEVSRALICRSNPSGKAPVSLENSSLRVT